MKYTMQRSNGYVDSLEPSVERPAFGKNDPQRQASTEPVTTCHNHLNAELNSPGPSTLDPRRKGALGRRSSS